MITKSELIEYLKHTPENTNYNILYSSLYNGSNKEAVDEFIEVLSRGNLSLAALQPYLAKLYEDDKTISPEPLPPFSSGGSVPKPLTYDYMPEGYPKKTMGTVTVMAEQELAFYDDKGSLERYGKPADPFNIVEGQTYIVNWDRTEYECVCSMGSEGGASFPYIGNLFIGGLGDDTGEPFVYTSAGLFVTLDTSASHTISVKKAVETITPMSEEFIPKPLTYEFIPKPLTYEHMPEGYPSKSRFTIEWDGNTEGLTAQGSWYKVSDLVVDPAVFASGATLTYADGYTDFMSIDAAIPKKRITIEPGKITFGEGQVKIFTETPEAPYEAFEIGVYFESSEFYEVRKVTGGEVITPMAEEFIPNIPAEKLPAGGVTTLHINVTAVDREAMLVTACTADKTPEEMKQASINGPIWCVVTFAAGVMSEEAVSIGVPPAYSGGSVAFGMLVGSDHEEAGTNLVIYAVTPGDTINPWSIDLSAFGS